MEQAEHADMDLAASVEVRLGYRCVHEILSNDAATHGDHGQRTEDEPERRGRALRGVFAFYAHKFNFALVFNSAQHLSGRFCGFRAGNSVDANHQKNLRIIRRRKDYG